ncbi:MAG: dTMP kinase [Bdellovibrionales bacterium]
MSGFFITFEGGEGGGKSTVGWEVANYLMTQGFNATVVDDNSSTEGSTEIRNILVRGDKNRWFAQSEVFLFCAGRYDIVRRVIRPALNAGTIVICDRFTDSTLVYQGYAGGLPVEDVKRCTDLACDGLIPDLTVIFDLDAKLALERSGGYSKGEDRFESIGLEFHSKVRDGFLRIAANEPERCVVVDASQPLEVVVDTVKKAVLERLSTRRK